MCTRVEFSKVLFDENDTPFACFCVCNITTECDPAGTGDSPTAYEIEILSAMTEDGFIKLTPWQEERVLTAALEIMQG
jgi:hypothetical protein